MNSNQKFHTDTNYLSIDEFKKTLGDQYETKKWIEVLDYRKLYTFELPLIFDKNNFVHLTQTPWILQKEIKMISEFSRVQQKMLINISTKYSSSTIMDDIEMKSMTSDIHWIINKNQKRNIASRSIIFDIVSNIEEPNNEDEKYILQLHNNLEKISNELTSPFEIAKTFYNFKDFDKKRYEDIHTSLMNTITSDKIASLITKSSSIIFGINNEKIFGENSSEITALSLMSLLRNSYKGEILKGISFFKSLNYYSLQIQNSINIVKKDNGDLTYLTQLFNLILIDFVKLSNEQIETFIKNESRYNSLSMKDKNKNIKLILGTNPKITEKQAKFFVEHKDPHSNYTIKDFQNYFNISYETARYSIDNLTLEGFYNKKKVGKKYVYNPIRQ